ncbi:MAG: LysR family transcriptional regulator, partial [Rhodobiaceae bacterium]|nr:LysR family transcriptional regulator [Rhodobiaceae bacterium]
YGLPGSDAEIAAHRLIHLEEPFRPAADWADWFARCGLPPPAKTKGLLMNDYVLVMQAVYAGQGIGLGWLHLVEHLIASGYLVPVSQRTLVTGGGFHVVWPADRPLSDNIRRVRDWILSAPAPATT